MSGKCIQEESLGVLNCKENEPFGILNYIYKAVVLHSTSSFAIKKSRFDFADELKVGDVRYKHLTSITIKVQLFWRLSYEM